MALLWPAAPKFGLLTGQIVAVDTPRLAWMCATCAVVIVALALMWRPLTFAGVDPEVAAARGVPARLLSVVFLLTLGLAVAAAIQVIGALLVLALMVTPAAAAYRVSANPAVVTSPRSVFWSTSPAAWWPGAETRPVGRRGRRRSRPLRWPQPPLHSTTNPSDLAAAACP